MAEPVTGVIDATLLNPADSDERTEPAWGAVVSLALGVFGLVTAEFLPASLLTPLARDLGIPVYDVQRVGYPQRVRDWNARQKIERQRGAGDPA